MFKGLFNKCRFFTLILALPLLGMGAMTSSLYASEKHPIHQQSMQQATSMSALASLMAQRLHLAEDIATYQWNHTLPIDNPATEKALLDHLIIQAKAYGVNEKFASQFFIAQIDALNAACINHFDVWVKENVHQHPYTPTISVLNQKLDQIDRQIIMTLKDLKEVNKIQLIQALQDFGFTRDVIDASINF
jgi:chorismate mutase-like protein